MTGPADEAPPGPGGVSDGTAPDMSPRHLRTPSTDGTFILYTDGADSAHLSTISEAAEALAAAPPNPDAPPFLWIDMLQPTDEELAELAARFDLHPLAVEDAVEAHQRPKYERYGATDFMVLRPAAPLPRRQRSRPAIARVAVGAPDGTAQVGPAQAGPAQVGSASIRAAADAAEADAAPVRTDSGPPPIVVDADDAPDALDAPGAPGAPGTRAASGTPDASASPVAPGTPDIAEVVIGELHIFLGADFVIVIRHTPAIDIEAVRSAFENDPRFFEHAQFSALYRIMDRVVDDYDPLLVSLEDRADALEEQLFGTGPIPSQDMYRLSRELIELERAVSPLSPLMAAVSTVLEQHTVPSDLARGMRDVADHIHGATERIERLRQLLREIFTVNSTLISERQNEDMRRMNELSITQNEHMKKISAWAGILFFPSLVAGVYGMNFQHMPELHWLMGYPFALALMVVGCAIFYTIFKRVDWL